MNYTACLVVINDLGGRSDKAETSRSIANRLHCQYVREYDLFPAGGRSLGREGLQQRAESILRDLVANNRLALGVETSTEHPTVVFIGYGLGGLLVKQILLSAALSTQHTIVSQSTDLLVFLGTFHRTEPTMLLSQPIPHVQLLPRTSEISQNRLLLELQSVIPSLENDFRTMLGNKYDIVNIIEKSGANCADIASNKYSSTIGIPREENIQLPCTYAELWTTAITGQSVADVITKKLERAAEARIKVPAGAALQLAVKANQLPAVETLLETVWLSDKNAALVLAVQLENTDIIRMLISSGAEVKATGSSCANRSPLHVAAEKGNEAIMYDLLKTKTGHELFEYAVPTLVSLAANNGHVMFVRTLFTLNREHARPEKSEEKYDRRLLSRLLMTESISGSHEALRTLCEATIGKDLQGFAGDILQASAKYGHNNIIDSLVENGVEIDYRVNLGDTPLILASQNDQLSACKCLIGHGADINGIGCGGRTALIVACQLGLKDLAELFLNHDADIWRTDSYGIAPLHAAANAPEIISLLLEKSPRPIPEMRTCKERTPLSEAVIMGNLQSVDLLLEENVMFSDDNGPGTEYLNLAIKKGHFHIVKRLIDGGVDCDARDFSEATPLHHAAYSGFHEAVEYLIPKIEDINAVSKYYGPALSSLVVGARNKKGEWRNHIKCAETLIGNGANVNCHGGRLHSALQAAVWHEVKDLVILFIQHHANVDARGGEFTTALNAAVECERTDLVKILLEAGASPTVKLGYGGTILSHAITGSTTEVAQVFLDSYGKAMPREILEDAIRAAARAGRVEIFKSLVSKHSSTELEDSGIRLVLFDAVSVDGHHTHSMVNYLLGDGKDLFNLNETDAHGTTALAYTIECGSDKMNAILNAGADPNIADIGGNTPVILAAKSGCAISVESLLLPKSKTATAARIDMVDFAGRGALYWACYSGEEDLFRTVMGGLTDQGAKTADYSSAVHAASVRNNVTFLEQLLEAGADPTQPDRNNWSATDTAKEYKADDVLQLLVPFLSFEAEHVRDSLEMKRPTAWNRFDASRHMEVSGNGLRITLKGLVNAAMARGDFCMPSNAPFYYFEVTIEKLVPRGGSYDRPTVTVGFCEEDTPLDGGLGISDGAWGHNLYQGSFYTGYRGGGSGPDLTGRYAEGDTIGCGIDFRNRTAFFTKNGIFTMNAFSGIRGKLYPAVSFGPDLDPGTCVSANFGNDPAVEFKYNPYISYYQDDTI